MLANALNGTFHLTNFFLPIGNRITFYNLMLQKLDENRTFLFERILLIVLIDLSISEIGNIFIMACGLNKISTEPS